MNIYTQGDDFAICKGVLPEIANLNDYQISLSILPTGMLPIIEASTIPIDGELKIYTRHKQGWFVNIPSEVSNKLFPEVYDMQVTYKNLSTSTKHTYIYSAIFSIKTKIY